MSDKFISASEIRELLGIAPDGDCKKCRFLRGMFGCQQSRDFVRVCEAIDDCSAADVRTVVRGRWIDVSPAHIKVFRCDQCGEETTDTCMDKPRANFCPNCGADMRKVVEIDQVKEDAE